VEELKVYKLGCLRCMYICREAICMDKYSKSQKNSSLEITFFFSIAKKS